MITRYGEGPRFCSLKHSGFMSIGYVVDAMSICHYTKASSGKSRHKHEAGGQVGK